MSDSIDANEIFPSRSTVTCLKESMLKSQNIKLKEECLLKPKLRTFLSFKDFDSVTPHIGKPLSFHERRMISKLRLGILPIRLETARYMRPLIPEQERVCYCGSQDVESEIHVLFHCSMYDSLREIWMKNLCVPDNFKELPINEKLKQVLNRPENVRPTAKFVVSLMDKRSLSNKLY